MKRGHIIRSKFKGVYLGMTAIWLAACMGFLILIDTWVVPQVVQGRLHEVENLIQSQHEQLLFKNHRSTREALFARGILDDDRNFEQLWIESDRGRIESIHTGCRFITHRSCIHGDSLLVFNEPANTSLEGVSFAILLNSKSIQLISKSSLYWKISGALLLAVLFGSVAWGIRRQEIFLIGKLELLAKHQAKIKSLFKHETHNESDGLDEFELISESLEHAESMIRDRTEQIERYKVQFERHTEEVAKVRLEAEKNKALAQLASQLSHDIRSPLAALHSIIQNTENLDEQSRVLVRTAISRMGDIANDLLNKARELQPGSSSSAMLSRIVSSSASMEPLSVELLTPIVDIAVSHQRVQLVGLSDIEIIVNVDNRYIGISSAVQRTELSRILMNLLRNSVEALDGHGIIEVSLTQRDGKACIEVKDNGKGIPSHLLSKVVEPGGTFGKVNGNGLGLSHAKRTMERWDGILLLESTLNHGTTVTLILPQAETPSWFADSIHTPERGIIVVADDDASIHELWKRRYQGRPLVHCYSLDELLTTFRQNALLSDNEVLYLCDYEFSGQSQSGLDFIEMMGIAEQSILVTSRFEESEIRQRCKTLGLRLLPKMLAGVVPLYAPNAFCTPQV